MTVGVVDVPGIRYGSGNSKGHQQRGEHAIELFFSERASDMPLPQMPCCKLPGHHLPIMGLFYANVQFIGGTNATFRVLFALHRGG